MESRDKVELALRAANVARMALDMLDVQSNVGAKQHFEYLVRSVMELDQFIEKLERAK